MSWVLPLRNFLSKRPVPKKEPERAQGCYQPITLNRRGFPQHSSTTGAYVVGAERSGATERRPTIQTQTDSEWEKSQPQGYADALVLSFSEGENPGGKGRNLFLWSRGS
jgi:hypothetical protein